LGNQPLKSVTKNVFFWYRIYFFFVSLASVSNQFQDFKITVTPLKVNQNMY